MSPHDEDEEQLNRSIKLCQRIYERKIDSEIGIEIGKLLEEGVLINFQDQNRKKKTAIHLAVGKCDVICVKFLLRFKPDLKVKDGDGKTPVELAESKGYQDIRDILLNGPIDVVNEESHVGVIDYQSLTPQKIDEIESTFKVLKLTYCPTAKEVWKKLNDQNYTTALKESSHLFFISIEIETKKDIQNDLYDLMKKVLNLRRPMIVQLISADSKHSKIYFKDESDESDFVEITDTQQITQEEFNVSVQSDDDCNMKLLVAALRSNLFGNFTGNLLGTKLNTNKDRSKAIDLFAKSNALCHQFFKLFDEGPPSIDRIRATLSFKGDHSLLALLDLPFELKYGNEKLKLNEYQQDILSVDDSRGCNLLMMAAKQRNLDALKLLIRCDGDFNQPDKYGKHASDMCWEMKSFDCLAELIEAGSPYPNNFHIDEVVKPSEAARISAMIETTNTFHKNIEQGEAKKIKKFITSYPHIKHAYDTNNKCALTVALQSKQVNIFSELLIAGFRPGTDNEYCEVLNTSENKDQIPNSHRIGFKEAFDEPHLTRLLRKSRLSRGSTDRANCSTIIRNMFDVLNGIKVEIIPILQICSLSGKLQIVFDFNCDSVVDMDPSRKKKDLGLTYEDGCVYIGAKNYKKPTEFYEVIGVLIHELTHYAMKLTYGNGFKPYKVGDTENTKQFESITAETKNICDKNPSTDSIVAEVFDLYNQSEWHQELIVRVPQLLAQRKTDSKALKAAELNIPELFKFYREKILKDVEIQSKVLLRKYLVSKINSQTGIARNIENLNVEFKKVEMNLKPSAHIITSNAPQLTLAMLRQNYCADSHSFVTLEQVAIGNILDKIAKADEKESSTALIVDCIGLAQKYQESLQKLLKDIKNMKTIALVMTEAESSKAKEKFPEVESKTFDHKWAELTESSKVHLLDQNVIFQGVEMKLKELVEPSSEAMNFFPLDELVDCKDFKIGHELPRTMYKYYIPRKFIKKGQANAKSFEDKSSMIISDDAGSGKSVTLFEVAKSLHDAHPDRWVQFVDLKCHIEAFKSIEEHEKIEAFEDFITQNILKNEPKFDRELFREMFQSGKTFILFDGFDEISPNYKDLLLHVLRLFETKSGNQFYITTRPHLEADLEGALGNFVFKLENFSKESQISFLRDYWQSVGFKISDEDFKVLSQRLLNKFSRIAASDIGLPLLMRMTSEIFDDPSKENLLSKVDSLSIASVFRQFVEKYLARWTNNENEITRSETVEFQMAGGVLGVHHSIALDYIFDDKFMNFEINESLAEKISRVGIIKYDKTVKTSPSSSEEEEWLHLHSWTFRKARSTLQFIHQTFAEYFVADFIWFHLNKKNRNPSHDCRMAIEVLFEVVWSYDYEVVQTFLEQILKAKNFSPNETFCKSVAKCLSEVFKSKGFYLFHFCEYADRKHLVELLLSIYKHVEKEVLLKMLQIDTDFGESVFLTLSGESKAIVSTLCDIITNCTDDPKKIYQYEHENGNILLCAGLNGNSGVLEILCANLDSVLTKDEIKVMFQQNDGIFEQNIIANAARNNKEEVFLELISLLPDYLSPDEIKSLMQEVDHRKQNFFHHAVSRDTNERLKLKLEVVKSHLSIEDRKIFFYQPAIGPNMFHCAAQNKNEKTFQTTIESTRDVLRDIKPMLMQKDSEGSNVLHMIATYGNEVTLNDLNLLLRERLADDEIRSLLLEVNKKGQNCFRLAANNAELNFQVFCETIGSFLSTEDQTRLLQQSIHEIDIIRLACESYTNEILPVETIKELLTRKDEYGWNACHKMARDGNVDKWKKLISFAQARFSADEMKRFLFCNDKFGANCLHRAANRRNENMIEAICQTIKNVGLSVEDQKKFVRQKDSENRNVFHRATIRIEIKSLNFFSLFDDLSTILD